MLNLIRFQLPQLGATAPAPFLQHARGSKHWLPKWKKFRTAKVIKPELPDFQKEKERPETPDEADYEKRLKEMGLQPPRPWMERGFYISSTGAIIEPYVPPEGDGKLSAISLGGVKQKAAFVEKKGKSLMAYRKIRQYEEDFGFSAFAPVAKDIYLQAHTYLAQKDFRRLQEFVTERCYPEMIHNVKQKTVRWKFVGSLEPPRVVHARTGEMISKDNLFGQVTVRFHTQQTLAVYDRFGRLMHGSEIVAKDVLEYVVFEKHLSNVYGTWRMHSKIVPDWMPERPPAFKTLVASDEPAPSQEEGVSRVATTST